MVELSESHTGGDRQREELAVMDSEKRAIVDRKRGRYAVLDGDVHYYHESEHAETEREERDGIETGIAEPHERGEASERDEATGGATTTDEETTTQEEAVADQTRA